MMQAPVSTTREQWLSALGLVLLTVVLLVSTHSAIGIPRDESFYIEAARVYGRWFALLFNQPTQALSDAAIVHSWSFNSEHPPFVKSLFAWCWLIEARWHVFGSERLACRFAPMVLHSVAVGLVYLWGTQSQCRRVGWFAALFYLLLPRVFYHAHLACFDVPIASMVLISAYAYWRSLTRTRWVWCFGIVFGLTLATKHNSWLVPPVLMVHWLIWARHTPTTRRANWFWSMLIVSVCVFYLSWPLLWVRPIEHLRWYARFHMQHEYYNMAYWGVNYFKPPFPKSYPWVMTGFTVPMTSLALGVMGLIYAIRRSVRVDAHASTFALWTGLALVPLLVYLLPHTPIFGGTKHWFPAYPFFSLCAGSAFDRLCARAALGPWVGALEHRRKVGLALAAGLLLLPASIETWRGRRFGLSYYNALAGGTRGAADKGMNRTFWGVHAVNLAPYLRRRLPLGGRIWLGDTTQQAWQLLQAEGLVPRTIIPAGNLADADVILVDEEHHFAEVHYQAWQVIGDTRPDHVLTFDGVPIVTVYFNPHPQR